MATELSRAARSSAREFLHAHGREFFLWLRERAPATQIGKADDSNLLEYAALTGAKTRGYNLCIDDIAALMDDNTH